MVGAILYRYMGFLNKFYMIAYNNKYTRNYFLIISGILITLILPQGYA